MLDNAFVLLDRHRNSNCFRPKASATSMLRERVARPPVFVLRHHTGMIANRDGSVYSTRRSVEYAVYREDQWQRRSKHTELES